jgi:hypothetical protein
MWILNVIPSRSLSLILLVPMPLAKSIVLDPAILLLWKLAKRKYTTRLLVHKGGTLTLGTTANIYMTSWCTPAHATFTGMGCSEIPGTHPQRSSHAAIILEGASPQGGAIHNSELRPELISLHAELV